MSSSKGEEDIIYVEASFFKDIFGRFFSEVRERYSIYFIKIALKLYQEENEANCYGKKDTSVSSQLSLKNRIEDLKRVGLRDEKARKMVISLLIPLLLDKDATIRAAVTETLGIFKKEISIELVMMMLKDPIWDVRAAAAQTLGELGCEEAFSLLISVLDEENDENVREAIIRSIGKFQHRIPVETLGKILLNDPDWLVREAAAWSLGELGEAAPIAYLAYAFRSDPDEIVRAAAAESLGKSRNRQAKQLLQDVQIQGEHQEVMLAIQTALEELEKNPGSSYEKDLQKKEYRTEYHTEDATTDILRDIFCVVKENSTEVLASERNIIGVTYNQERRNTEDLKRPEVLYKIESLPERDLKKLQEQIHLSGKEIHEK